MSGADLATDDIELSLGLPNGHRRFQASDGENGIAPARGLFSERKWKQHLDLCPGREDGIKIEGSGQDSHDLSRLAIKRNRPSHDAAIAIEMLVPESVTEQSCLASIPDTFFIAEPAPQQWTHTKNVQEILGDAHAAQTLWVPLID